MCPLGVDSMPSFLNILQLFTTGSDPTKYKASLESVGHPPFGVTVHLTGGAQYQTQMQDSFSPSLWHFPISAAETVVAIGPLSVS